MDPSPLTRGKLTLTHSLPLPHWLIPAHAGKTAGRLPPDAGAAAHPRSRGENFSRPKVTPLLPGSSPLTRGKRVLTPRPAALARLIPAHAGKTVELVPVVPGRTAHPRSRGENRTLSLMICISVGSSPLTRGKRRDRQVQEHAVRLIPAHAGKTRRCARCACRRGAHPRSRGENMAVSLILSALAGSSPLTRGKPRPRLRSRSRQRLIPAHAGKTLTAESCSAASTAHPRSRGENICVHRGPHNGLGSSPLTRGKRNPSTSSAAAARLIPAHAGKTAVGYVVKSAAEAHPRSRGENGRIEVTDRAAPGSSPLTRGKHNHQSPVPHQAAAHPRSRGENMASAKNISGRMGSSPLTRGKPWQSMPQKSCRRLIPAHAGKTCSWPGRSPRKTAHPRSRGENASSGS